MGGSKVNVSFENRSLARETRSHLATGYPRLQV
jgi:hypothetical protein